MGDSISKFFEEYLEEDKIFADKSALMPSYMPKTIEHRDEQCHQIAHVLAPALKNHKPSNILIYGKTGTGKTVVVKYTTQQMEKIAKQKQIPLKVIYQNCKLGHIADTEYRLIAALTRELGQEVPYTGLPTEEIYRIFRGILEKEKQNILLILDEIDHLVEKCGDEILYNLTRLNAELQDTKISIIGISNNLLLIDSLDPRVKSSLGSEEIVFAPYNAMQIKSILQDREKLAFKPNVVQIGVIEKCAAYSAKEHGDARRAIELLRIAGELAEREQCDKVEIKHLDAADHKLEGDTVSTLITTQPKQHQLVLYSILAVSHDKKRTILTGEVYEFYESLCKRTGLRPLTQRRVSDIISEFDMLGMISASVISKGRFGRTREISIALSPESQPKVQELLEQAIGL